MALIFADLVEETTTTTGTGSYTLAGASAGFQTFASGIGTSNETFYAVTDGTDWEVSRGTLSDGMTLTRAAVLDSSNSGSAVNWAAGSKRIYAVAPAYLVGLIRKGQVAQIELDTVSGNVDVDMTADAVVTLTASGATDIDLIGTGDLLPNTRTYVQIDATNANNVSFNDTINWYVPAGGTSTTFADTGITLGSFNCFLIEWNGSAFLGSVT